MHDRILILNIFMQGDFTPGHFANIFEQIITKVDKKVREQIED